MKMMHDKRRVSSVSKSWIPLYRDVDVAPAVVVEAPVDRVSGLAGPGAGALVDALPLPACGMLPHPAPCLIRLYIPT